MFLWGWWGLGTPLGFLPCASAASPSTASPYRVLPPPPSAAYPSRVRHPFRLQFAGLLLRWGLVVGLEGYLLRHLVFSHVPCSSSGACSLSIFPSCRLPRGFQVTGCLSCFPGEVGWASALPFFFCASPAPLACSGWLGYAPCVRVLQLRCCLLGLKVRSPCCPSLTLGWVCFWPTVSQAFVGCEGGFGCPSWFVLLFMCLFVLHLFWGWGGLVTGLWPLLRLLGFGLF